MQNLSWRKTKTFKRTLIRKLRLSLSNRDGENGLGRVLITLGMSRGKPKPRRIEAKRLTS